MGKKKTLMSFGEWTKTGMQLGALVGAGGLLMLCGEHCSHWYEFPSVAATGALLGGFAGSVGGAICAAIDNALASEDKSI